MSSFIKPEMMVLAGGNWKLALVYQLAPIVFLTLILIMLCNVKCENSWDKKQIEKVKVKKQIEKVEAKKQIEINKEDFAFFLRIVALVCMLILCYLLDKEDE